MIDHLTITQNNLNYAIGEMREMTRIERGELLNGKSVGEGEGRD